MMLDWLGSKNNDSDCISAGKKLEDVLRIFGKMLMDKAVRTSDDNPWLKHVWSS